MSADKSGGSSQVTPRSDLSALGGPEGPISCLFLDRETETLLSGSRNVVWTDTAAGLRCAFGLLGTGCCVNPRPPLTLRLQ